MAEINVQDQKVLDQIFQRGVMIDLFTSRWDGQEKLRPEDLGIPKDSINEDLFSLGRKRFIPKEWIGRFRKFDSEARWAVGLHAFHFKKGTGYFVPFKALPVLVEKLEGARDGYIKVVKEFMKEYPRIRIKMIEEYKKEVSKIYKRLSSYTTKLPDPKTFEETFMNHVREFYPKDPSPRFQMSWSFFEITFPREFKMKALNLKKKIKKEEMKEKKEQLIINQYRESMNQQIQSFLGTIVSQLRNTTAELVEKVTAQIKEGKVTEGRLGRITEFINRFKLLNFVDDIQMERELENLKKIIGTNDAEQFNSDDALRGKLNKVLNGVLEVAERDDSSKVLKKTFGYSRKIRRN